jgi:hypothetical protein
MYRYWNKYWQVYSAYHVLKDYTDLEDTEYVKYWKKNIHKYWKLLMES